MARPSTAFAASLFLQSYRLTPSGKQSVCKGSQFIRHRSLPTFSRAYHRSSMATMAAASQAAESPQFASLFPNGRAMVLANDGSEVNLVDFVAAKNSAVILGWLRHYGCTLCKKQTADWIAMRANLKALDCGPVSMILIGNGKPHQAADFAEEMGWEEDLFSDPSRETYQALEFKKGLSSLLTLSSLQNTINSFKAGNKQTLSRIPTDPLQQGGAIVVNKAGTVTLFHRDAVAGDHAAIDDLVDAISAAIAAESITVEQKS